MSHERVEFVLIFLGFMFQTNCYIFDVGYSYLHPTNGTQYTTVFLQQQSNTGFRLLAGAPRSDKVALCNTKLCREFHLNVKNVAGYEMLGASISGGDNADDPTYICAPRYIVSQQYRVNGRCFAMHSNFKPITSLDNVYNQVQIFNSSYEFLYAHGQAGFSVKHVKNNEFLLGAPGVLSWKGTIIKHTSFEAKDIVLPEKKINRNSYLGYSIEFGSFYFSGTQRYCVIAGAPRGDNLLGQVYIFDYANVRDIPLRIIKGDQISSYYGSSLLATKNHLFVGAPMYNVKTYEEGCVFVYRNYADDLVFWEKICGHHRGGRFGTAMSNIGVLDGISNIGIAISAPYADNGGGIIYIYVQNDNGFKEIQQIAGKSVTHNIAGFGIDLSNGLDIDQNAYNDFAVGSLVSDVLVVLRSRKVLHFNAYVNSYVDKIRTNSKNLTIGYCYVYTGRKGANDTLTATVQVESDGRVVITNSKTSLQSKIGDTSCQNFLLTLKPHAFDSPSPLKLKFTNKLAECPECPVVYPKKPAITHEIPFVTGCGDENVCVPDLRLQATFQNITELVIGSRDSVSLTVLVSNLGETAFVCKMNVTVPTEIRQFPPACSKVENILHCDISNRLLLNQKKQLEFQLDVKRLNPRLKEIKIDVSVSSAGSGNGSTAQLSLTLPVSLKSQLSLIGFSNPEYVENRESMNFTHEYVVFNGGPSPLLNERIEFKIPANVVNKDGGIVDAFVISPLADECIPFNEPPARNVRDLSYLQQMLKDVPQHIKFNIGCQNDSLIGCKVYHCSIGELNANSSMKFKFRMEIMTSLLFITLGKHIEEKSLILIESTAKTIDESLGNEVMIRTVMFRKIVEVINLWMWIGIAVVGSIIILSIIIFILYKLKFFARPMRERMLSEEEHKQERECMLVGDDCYAEEGANGEELFNDIKF
ncbi:hypothetical protein Trydic_g9408 [Trypoxylus dichotomus]